MAFKLLSVAPRQGLAWIVAGWGVFRLRPMSFVGLFATFMIAAIAISVVPFIGGIIGLATVPLLSVGFMIASRRAKAGEAVRATVLIDALRGDPVRRGSMLRLCGLYALVSMLVVMLGHWADGGALLRLQELLAGGNPARDALALALADPRLYGGLLVYGGLFGLVSVPFWHAPALIHWGGQGTLQALFSSTLAIWRNRAAFGVYLAAWLAVMFAQWLMTAVLVTAVVAAGLMTLAGVIVTLGVLVLSAWFYASLWFCFSDSFGEVPEPGLA
jgi:hypothetical protein